jgi:hypothetical protein
VSDDEDAWREMIRVSEECGMYDLDHEPCACGRAQPCRHCEEAA